MAPTLSIDKLAKVPKRPAGGFRVCYRAKTEYTVETRSSPRNWGRARINPERGGASGASQIGSPRIRWLAGSSLMVVSNGPSDNAVMQVRPADEEFSSAVSKGCEEHQLTCAEAPTLLRPLADYEHSKAQESIPAVLKMMTGFWTFCCFLALVVAAFKQR